MKYPDDFLNKIITGDCLDVMKQMPDGCVDLVLTDPPYGIDFLSQRTNNHNKIANDGLSEFLFLLPKALMEFKRILTETGVCCCCGGGGKTPSSALLTLELVKHFHLIQTVIWDKKTIGLGWRYRPSYETILVFSKSKNNYNFYDTSKKVSNIFRYNNIIPQKGDHPTPKPVALMGKFIALHTQENDIVLDPFCGSGTTPIACHRLNRKYIGIELEEKYVEIAKKRIETETRQMKLF